MLVNLNTAVVAGSRFTSDMDLLTRLAINLTNAAQLFNIEQGNTATAIKAIIEGKQVEENKLSRTLFLNSANVRKMQEAAIAAGDSSKFISQLVLLTDKYTAASANAADTWARLTKNLQSAMKIATAEMTQGGTDIMKGTIKEFTDGLVTIRDDSVEIGDRWDKIIKLFRGAYKAIAGVWVGVMDTTMMIGDAVEVILEYLYEFGASQIWDAFVDVISTAWDIVKGIVSTVLELLMIVPDMLKDTKAMGEELNGIQIFMKAIKVIVGTILMLMKLGINLIEHAAKLLRAMATGDLPGINRAIDDMNTKGKRIIKDWEIMVGLAKETKAAAEGTLQSLANFDMGAAQASFRQIMAFQKSASDNQVKLAQAIHKKQMSFDEDRYSRGEISEAQLINQRYYGEMRIQKIKLATLRLEYELAKANLTKLGKDATDALNRLKTLNADQLARLHEGIELAGAVKDSEAGLAAAKEQTTQAIDDANKKQKDFAATTDKSTQKLAKWGPLLANIFSPLAGGLRVLKGSTKDIKQQQSEAKFAMDRANDTVAERVKLENESLNVNNHSVYNLQEWAKTSGDIKDLVMGTSKEYQQILKDAGNNLGVSKALDEIWTNILISGVDMQRLEKERQHAQKLREQRDDKEYRKAVARYHEMQGWVPIDILKYDEELEDLKIRIGQALDEVGNNTKLSLQLEDEALLVDATKWARQAKATMEYNLDKIDLTHAFDSVGGLEAKILELGVASRRIIGEGKSFLNPKEQQKLRNQIKETERALVAARKAAQDFLRDISSDFYAPLGELPLEKKLADIARKYEDLRYEISLRDDMDALAKDTALGMARVNQSLEENMAKWEKWAKEAGVSIDDFKKNMSGIGDPIQLLLRNNAAKQLVPILRAALGALETEQSKHMDTMMSLSQEYNDYEAQRAAERIAQFNQDYDKLSKDQQAAYRQQQDDFDAATQATLDSIQNKIISTADTYETNGQKIKSTNELIGNSTLELGDVMSAALSSVTQTIQQELVRGLVNGISNIHDFGKAMGEMVKNIGKSLLETGLQLLILVGLVNLIAALWETEPANVAALLGISAETAKALDFTGNLQGNAQGGMISGPGTGTSDSIPSMLSNGEYVVKASSVKKWGTGFLDMINSGVSLPRLAYADGGMVGDPADVNVAAPNVEVNNRIVNVLDPSMMADALSSKEGERQVLNIIRRNPKFITEVVG
jgi:hypothetical protein